MKIVHIIPGSGGGFYCQNCMRDNELVHALRGLGHNVTIVPMYLPLNLNTSIEQGDTPVFYGAINVYLKQQLPLFRYAPLWLERVFDSKPLLQLAARLSGSTSAEGLEEMTISMLMGEQGKQATELDHLIRWLKHEEKPDVIHLSNALLLGLAPRLKQELSARLYCTLQDEHQWIDPMHAAYQQRVWQLMADKARFVDRFITVSHYYAQFMQKNLQLPESQIALVPMGIQLNGYESAASALPTPVIGYLNRLSEMFGLETLLDAYILLKKKFRHLELHLTGGYTAADKPFLKRLQNKINRAGVRDSVKIFTDFQRSSRLRFLRSLSVLSVPVPYGEAFGTYLIEALASGVPVVQPRAAAFPEFIQATGGGLLCEPNDPASLAEKISGLLLDPALAIELGRQGRQMVMQNYSIEKMAERMAQAYQTI